jgi:hypothetical protein
MKIFQCDNCYQAIFFENTQCENCGAALGYWHQDNTFVALQAHNEVWQAMSQPDKQYRYCENHQYGACNWLIPADSPDVHCLACALNDTIPNLDNPDNVFAWQNLEQAKHQLVYSLLRLGLPLQPKSDDTDSEDGLAFDFLEQIADDEDYEAVFTGHAQGLVTINIAEADAAYREKMRQKMGEAYRTLIGHFRHEIGHYYWDVLIRPDEAKCLQFRQIFGDERADYAEAMDKYYLSGPPPSWRAHFISAYAVSHPWEDWAETWAHYLHLLDTLETAHTFGVSLNPQMIEQAVLNVNMDFDPYQETDFDKLLTAYIPLTFAINSINRGMGLPDLYPFVLSPPALAKLRFVHQLVISRRRS